MGNKVVARFLDGSVGKGLIFHFDPDKKNCSLKDPDQPYEEGRRILLSELKALFFVRTLEGKRDYKSESDQTDLTREKKIGKKIAITFVDGEVLYALAYDLDRFSKGFYAFPIDEEGNNERLFVFRHAVKSIEEERGTAPG